MKKASKTAAPKSTTPKSTTGVRTSVKARMTTDSAESFFSRSRDRARRLDRGEKLPAQITVAFEDPSDLLRVLSAERVRLLRGVRREPLAVSKLASDLGRDRQAVRRDVSLLESLGLLKTREEPNPGHGRRRIVEALAAQYQLVAMI
jgi:predicted transcriptional regulator